MQWKPDIPILGASLDFPPIENALKNPQGLLAAGGDLSVERLLKAYGEGVFPWFEEDQPILWWSPDPRIVLFPEHFKPSRSLRKLLRQNRFRVTRDQAFDEVIEACSQSRSYGDGTWITDDMKQAYGAIHQAGFAHSIECYLDDELVGGLYGIGLGRLFFGESMFHRVSDASKVAFAHLVRMLDAAHCPLIDCQVSNPHLKSLGATEISRKHFSGYLSDIERIKPIDWKGLPVQLSPW
jgi:leucyl/phenylalanyl-tRNA--protein transferase